MGPSERYPDPRIVAVDDSFRRYMLASAKVERIASGFRWAEGPVWFGDMRMLLWSDIPNNAIMRWDEISGETSVFRYPANYSNGHARDRQGRLISCEHDTRRITRTEYDGSVTVLADSYQGKRLNSPNDIVVKSDGTIWFYRPAIWHQRLLRRPQSNARIAAKRLLPGAGKPQTKRGIGRHKRAKWFVFLAGRKDPVRGGKPGDTEPLNSGVGRGRQYAEK